MGMPQVPKRDKLPCIEDVVIQLLESVAIEELAMAHIINAEGEKMQALVKQMAHSDICCDCITDAFKQTNQTINSLIMKEWVMLNKINAAMDIYAKFDREEKPKPPCHGQKKCGKCHDECEPCSGGCGCDEPTEGADRPPRRNTKNVNPYLSLEIT